MGCIVRARASSLITDVPAFVNFHSSIPSYLLAHGLGRTSMHLERVPRPASGLHRTRPRKCEPLNVAVTRARILRNAAAIALSRDFSLRRFSSQYAFVQINFLLLIFGIQRGRFKLAFTIFLAIKLRFILHP